MLFGYFSQLSSVQLTNKIEHNAYNEHDLVEIKVLLNLPYYNSQDNYEAISGEITIQGNHYNYVKRKVSQDTLFLMCLPNTDKDNLQTAKTTYGEKANDIDGKKENKSLIKKEDSFSQYQNQVADYSLTPPVASVPEPTSFVSLFVPDSFITCLDLPPEVNS